MRRKAATHALFAFLIICVLPFEALATGRIEWRLENPFRLFKNPADTELHRQIYLNLSLIERTNPILSAERKLEERFGGRGWAEKIFNHTCYDQTANRYNACADYVLPKQHRIIASFKAQSTFLDLFQPDASSDSCQWQLEDRKGRVIGRGATRCDQQVKFDIPYPDGGKLSVLRGGAIAAGPIDIKIRDVLVLGLGDSFGSGDGNPDDAVHFDDSRSYDYGEIDIAASKTKAKLDGYPAREGKWKQLSGPDFRKERAKWWDLECHRSLYSHQVRAALQLAIENPQRAITFLSFSCSGAQITQGILLRTTVRECPAREEQQSTVTSQISSASQELCRSVSRDSPMPAAIIERIPELRSLSDADKRITRCEASSSSPQTLALKRPIDLVFLSVGGNDVGFVPLIADSMLSNGSIYRILGQKLNSVYDVDQARARIDIVRQRYDGLKIALEAFFGIPSSDRSEQKVIMTGYPNFGYAADGMSACSGTRGLEVFPAFQLDANKIAKGDAFSTDFNKHLASFAGRNWVYVDKFRNDFRSHGLCASDGEDAAETLAFPRLKDGAWTPFKPSTYPSYLPRQRWFRTPNDAYLSTHMHVDTIAGFGANCSRRFTGTLQSLAKRYWQPFQLFLSSTYGGAFHPTAEGQARIADEVADAARSSLRRALPASASYE